jgi:hypothetical protein
MISRYIEHLHHLALSIDFIDAGTLNKLHETMKSFFGRNLGPAFYEFNIDGFVSAEGEPGLKPIWTNSKSYDFATVRRQNGQYTGFVMYCYCKNKNLWITSKDGKPLSKDNRESYQDHWSKAHEDKELPAFWEYAETQIRTSICLPMRAGKPPYPQLGGFICLEFTDLLPYTGQLDRPLKEMAVAVGLLFQTWRYTEARALNTDGAVRRIEELARLPPFLRPHRPKVFFAYPLLGGDDVIGVIRNVLRSYPEFELVTWKDMSDSGNIHKQMLQQIAEARFGICYFSERSPNVGAGFTDSLNVVFEAGMFQALANDPTAEPEAWIPVREEESPRTPFDFAAERTVRVTRDNGVLNEEELRNALDRRLRRWREELSR